MMEYCPQLIEKWKAREKQNHKYNIEMILDEAHDEQPKIVVDMNEGMRIKVDMKDQGNNIH
jgi:hypothetical protein